MNSLIQVTLLLVSASLVLSSPLLPRHEATQKPLPPNHHLIQYESYDTDSGHKFSYDTQDGQSREEELIIKNKGSDEEEIVIAGHYSYKGPDGLIYNVNYTADKTGYHATVDSPKMEMAALLPGGLPYNPRVGAAPIPQNIAG